MAKPPSSRSRVRQPRRQTANPDDAQPGIVHDPVAAGLAFGRKLERDVGAVAEYIADMTAELAALAGAARLDMLTYFLNMARLEAEFHQRRRD